MDLIFSFLPVIIIFVVVLSKVFEGISGMFIEIQDNVNEEKQEKAGDIYEPSPEKTEIEEGRPQVIDQEKQVVEKQLEKMTTAPENNVNFREAARERYSKKSAREEGEKESDKTDEKNQDLTPEDLIRGVMFKEILDKPRAKRPYSPPYFNSNNQK